jgi:hypothetical protein
LPFSSPHLASQIHTYLKEKKYIQISVTKKEKTCGDGHSTSQGSIKPLYASWNQASKSFNAPTYEKDSSDRNDLTHIIAFILSNIKDV